VIVPAEEYLAGLPADAHEPYRLMYAQARRIHRCPFRESTPEAHMAASRFMVDRADRLFAVWDGEPARSYGGTADVVAYARETGMPVTVIWPDGATR
jgi:hypothetical protein